MSEFCKVFDDELIGQILVKLDSSDDDFKTEIRIYCKPKDMGVCSIALIYKDTEEGWAKAESTFIKMGKQDAIKIAKNIIERTL